MKINYNVCVYGKKEKKCITGMTDVFLIVLGTTMKLCGQRKKTYQALGSFKVLDLSLAIRKI